MKNTTASTRYAKALLDLALEKSLIDKVNEDAKLVVNVAQNHEFHSFINSPIINPDKKIEVFKELLGKHINELSLRFISLLTNKRRENLIAQIFEEYTNLYNKHKGIQKAIVITANGLDETLRKKVYSIVKDSMKSEVELIEKTDKSIIGGFVLKMGDTQIDSSVVRSIRNLKQQLQ